MIVDFVKCTQFFMGKRELSQSADQVSVKRAKQSVDAKKLTFSEAVKDKRLSCAKSVIEFAFNKKRARVLSSQKDCRDEAAGVLYWMSRDQRIQGRFF